MSVIKDFKIDSLKVRISNNERVMGEDVTKLVANKINEILKQKDDSI